MSPNAQTFQDHLRIVARSSTWHAWALTWKDLHNATISPGVMHMCAILLSSLSAYQTSRVWALCRGEVFSGVAPASLEGKHAMLSRMLKLWSGSDVLPNSVDIG